MTTLVVSLAAVSASQTSVAPTTTLAAQTANNTSAPGTFAAQSNGNSAPASVSKVDVHSLFYAGATTKVYAHLMLWFGKSNHMNVGYSSTDPNQVHKQITDMISRGIDGVIIDWYGPNNSEDDATKLVMAEAEAHPGFSFAIAVDKGAIEWDSCSGCSPQAALISQLQYIEQTYFPSKAYMRVAGRPVVTNFNIDLSYSVNWDQVNAALSSEPVYLFQNNSGFSHVLSSGSYSWVMPTTTDYGVGYLTSFYDTGMGFQSDQTVGAAYKGFNDTLASWGSNRIMGQQCGQTWLETFSEVNHLYNSGKQLDSLQLVTWNDYEEGTEIETGINNCLSISASASGNSLAWSIKGNENTVDHYVAYISQDGQNLMALAEPHPGTSSVNLCSYSIKDGNYIGYVQAVGKPSMINHMSQAVSFTKGCNPATPPPTPPTTPTLSLTASPSAMSIAAGGTGSMSITVTPQAGVFNNEVALSCLGLPAGLNCSFTPSSITPGTSGASSALTIKAATASANRRERTGYVFASGFLGFGLFGIAVVGRMSRRRVLVVIGACMVATLLAIGTSCAGISTAAVNANSSVKSYPVTISGSAGAVHISTTVTVTVQ